MACRLHSFLAGRQRLSHEELRSHIGRPEAVCRGLTFPLVWVRYQCEDRCFMRTEMDVLVLENQLLLKEEQPAEERDERWMQEFELD